MLITKKHLKQIIKEELEMHLHEQMLEESFKEIFDSLKNKIDLYRRKKIPDEQVIDVTPSGEEHMSGEAVKLAFEALKAGDKQKYNLIISQIVNDIKSDIDDRIERNKNIPLQQKLKAKPKQQEIRLMLDKSFRELMNTYGELKSQEMRPTAALYTRGLGI